MSYHIKAAELLPLHNLAGYTQQDPKTVFTAKENHTVYNIKMVSKTYYPL